MRGMSREEYLMRYGPDDARKAIIELRADKARQEEGDLFGEELDQGRDEERGRATQVARDSGGTDDPQGEDRRGGQARRQGGEASEAGADPQPPPGQGVTLVWPTAQKRFGGMFDHQIAAGYREYRQYLRTMNGRDAYADFLAEQVDGLMYATQLYLEAQAFVDLVVRAEQLFGWQLVSSEFEHELNINTWMREAQACLKNSGLLRSRNQNQK